MPRTKSRVKSVNIIFGSLGLALAGAVIYLLGSFPEGQPGEVGADFFPSFIAYGLGVSSLILIVASVLKKVSEEAEPFDLRDKGIQRAGIMLAATIIYCLAMDRFGFIICTVLYLLLMMLFLKERKYFQVTIIAGAITATVFLVFSVFLNITLPMGSILGF